MSTERKSQGIFKIVLGSLIMLAGLAYATHRMQEINAAPPMAISIIGTLIAITLILALGGWLMWNGVKTYKMARITES